MDASMGINWYDYLHCLSDNQLRELATWLTAESLKVSEFTDLVDRIYTQAPAEWRRCPPAFIATYGWPIVERYAHRKRDFAEHSAALEDAYVSGAFPNDVAAEELQPLRLLEAKTRSVDDVLSALEHMRSAS